MLKPDTCILWGGNEPFCDEYTDIHNKEQLTVCIWWFDNELEAHEDFFGFYNVPGTVASETIMSVIKDVLLRLLLSANNIMGHKTGVYGKKNPGPPTKGLTLLLVISEGVSCLKPLALADNTLFDLHNYLYHPQPCPIIAKYTAMSSRQLNQNCCISSLFTVIKGWYQWYNSQRYLLI